jgi:biopolymer transport protein TolR
MSDINMTPLIDVMLVLLVIFIITAPLMTAASSWTCRAPTAPGPSDAPASWPWPSTPTAACSWATKPVPPERPGAARARGGRAQPATEVQLRADRRVPYGRVAELIGLVQDAGLTRIGFVTEAAGQVAAAPRSRASYNRG